MKDENKKYEKLIVKEFHRQLKLNKKIKKEFEKTVKKKINTLYKKFTNNERSKIILSLTAGACAMGTVVTSAIANVQNRAIVNVLVLFVSGALAVINGVSAFNGFEELKVKRREFNKILEENLNKTSNDNFPEV